MAFSSYLSYAGSPSTIHILSYSILTGTTLWHSFLGGPIAYKTLPRQQFGTLQGRLFPPFFAVQTITAAVCFATSFYSVSATYNELVALGGIAVSGLLNLMVVGPWTTVPLTPDICMIETDGVGNHEREAQTRTGDEFKIYGRQYQRRHEALEYALCNRT